MSKQVSIHIVFRKQARPDAASYDGIDEENKLIEIDTTIGQKKKFRCHYHEYTHFMIDHYRDKFNWVSGWPKNMTADDKEETICYEIGEEVWGVVKKYLKKRKRNV